MATGSNDDGRTGAVLGDIYVVDNVKHLRDALSSPSVVAVLRLITSSNLIGDGEMRMITFGCYF
jgi:hypothetical protein